MSEIIRREGKGIDKFIPEFMAKRVIAGKTTSMLARYCKHHPVEMISFVCYD